MSEPVHRRVVVSGIRATGELHLGNLLGAIRQCAVLSQDPANDCFFFVADYHSLTTEQNPDELRRFRNGVVLNFLAAGIDPERATIYTQSSVPETTVLAWLLACHTPVGELLRMPHYKEKRDDLKKRAKEAEKTPKVPMKTKGRRHEVSEDYGNAGLLTYPVLMAADILGPMANIVPVGDDQRTHLEMARGLARRFNRTYGEIFPIPEMLVHSHKRVPSLSKHGQTGKMGKSNAEGAISLDASLVQISKIVKGAYTDPARITRDIPGNPKICNIFTTHEFVSSPKELAWARKGCKKALIGCGECKGVLIANLEAILAPIRERRAELLAKGDRYIEEILYEGGLRARKRIAETVERAKEMAGVPAAKRPEGYGGAP